VLLRSGRYRLPFGSIDVTSDPATARWGDLALSEFTPADELHIAGLQNRYRQRGIGALSARSGTALDSEQLRNGVGGTGLAVVDALGEAARSLPSVIETLE
jgi:hypothetical protein